MPPKLEEITAIYLRETRRWDDTIIADFHFPDDESAPALAEIKTFAPDAFSAGIVGDFLQERGIDFVQNRSVKTFEVKTDARPDELIPRLSYRLYGLWKTYENKRTGRESEQFHAKTWVKSSPHGRAGVIRYLVQAPHIGQATACKLWDKFGGDAVRVLRESPDVAVAAIASAHFTLGKATDAAAFLAVEQRLEDCSLDIIDLLDGKGFPKRTTKKAIEAWGNAAAEHIKRCPYRLMRFKGCGFLRCDQMYLDLGHPRGAMKRQALAAWYVLARDSDGHTWMHADFVESEMRRMLSVDCNPVGAIKLARRCRMIDVRRDARGDVWFSESKKAGAEASVAAIATRMIATAGDWPDVDSLDVSDHQREQSRRAFVSRLAILTGSPGTGKTYVAARVVSALVESIGAENIAVCAPTGKAAARISEAMAEYGVPIKATTIHSLLQVETSTDGEWRFHFGDEHPLPFRYVVTDECFPRGTLVDTPKGPKPIESVRDGDSILNAIGEDRVVATNRKEVFRVVQITAGKASFSCSENHPVFTARGVVIARDIRPGDSILQTGEAVRLLRNNYSSHCKSGNETFLQCVLLNEMVDGLSGIQGQDIYAGAGEKGGRSQGKISAIGNAGSTSADSKNPGTESYCYVSGNSRKNLREVASDGTQASRSRREWNRHDEAAVCATSDSGTGVETRVGDSAGREVPGLSHLLQGGPGAWAAKTGNRVRRPQAQFADREGTRCKEGSEAGFARVDRVEIFEQTDSRLDQFRDADGKLYFYDLQAARHQSFSVCGLLVHNCSMVGTGLMRSFLSACGPQTHVLLIGDCSQLPPVEHGAPLRDFIAFGVPAGELREIRRNSGTIVKACALIRDGQKFQVDQQLDPASGANLRCLETLSAGATIDTIIATVQTLAARGLVDPVWDCQVICALNTKGELNRRELNRRLQAAFNADGERCGENPFRVGDKIVCLKNTLLKPVDEEAVDADAGRESEEGDPPETVQVFVANGELLRVVEVKEKLTVAALLSGPNAGVAVKIPRGQQRDDDGGEGGDDEEEKSNTGCQFDLGFAISCHKSQGSEWKVVLVVLDPGGKRVCSREWLYTAISRGKTACFLIGDKRIADSMVERVALTRRKTFLVEQLGAASNG